MQQKDELTQTLISDHHTDTKKSHPLNVMITGLGNGNDDILYTFKEKHNTLKFNKHVSADASAIFSVKWT